MRMRVWMLVGAIVAVLLLVFGGVRPGWGDEEPQAAGQAQPPSITYGGSRSSSTWVSLEGGPRVAVGEGVEWQGVRVYLSLTWDLVGVDAKTAKVLYVRDVGAFWNTVTFKEIALREGPKRWAVELRPGPRQRSGTDRRQYHDLRTGAKLDVPGPERPPAGDPFRPRTNWYGDKSHVAEPFEVVVTTEANWKTVRERVFEQADLGRFGPIDFEREVLLVVSAGNGWNCHGIDFGEGYEDGARLLLRTRHHYYQTSGGAQKVRAWGVFVLPRRADKGYEVEINAQGLIGGPAIWKRIFRVDGLGEADKELARLPARSATPHHGPEGKSLSPPGPPPPRRAR